MAMIFPSKQFKKTAISTIKSRQPIKSPTKWPKPWEYLYSYPIEFQFQCDGKYHHLTSSLFVWFAKKRDSVGFFFFLVNGATTCLSWAIIFPIEYQSIPIDLIDNSRSKCRGNSDWNESDQSDWIADSSGSKFSSTIDESTKCNFSERHTSSSIV